MLKFVNIESGIKKLREILASFIIYDNTSSGLSSQDVQSAIDEIALNGGSGNPTNTHTDGGFANSTYLVDQNINGGNA